MIRSVCSALLPVLLVSLSIAAPPPAGPGSEIVCAGASESDKAAPPPKTDRYITRDFLTLGLAPSVAPSDSAYIEDLLDFSVPLLEEVVGRWTWRDTFYVVMTDDRDDGGSYRSGTIWMPPLLDLLGIDNDGDGRVDEDGLDEMDNDGDGQVDEDQAYDQLWDHVFVHEVIHGLQSGFYSAMPSWAIEGIAEAATYFVLYEANDDFGERARNSLFRRQAANADFLDKAGAQVLGGPEPPSARIDWRLAYGGVFAAFLIPAHAELSAGRTDPHPVYRLSEALYEDARGEWPREMYAAVDAAWTAPVDGVLPVSRWLRARSVANDDVRDGTFLAVARRRYDYGYNPEELWVLRFDRDGPDFRQLLPLGTLRYTGIGYEAVQDVAGDPFPVVPDLPPGAYRVDAEDEDREGGTLRARNWILVTRSGNAQPHEWKGTPVVFVDGDGLPVEIPDLSVNGRIAQRVPGGMVVEPLLPEDPLVVSSGGRTVGTITTIGDLHRMVVLPVEGECFGPVVSWSPYRPVAGESLRVRLRPGQSALEPDEDSVTVHLMGLRYLRSEVVVPLAPAGTAGVLEGKVLVPPEPAPFTLQFHGARSRHRSPSDSYFALNGYGFIPREPGAPSLAEIAFEKGVLLVRFEDPVDPRKVAVQILPQGAGRWEAAAPPEEDPLDPALLRWNLPRAFGKGSVRVYAATGAGPVLLASAVLGAGGSAPPRLALAPCPHPGRGEIRLRVEARGPALMELEIFDVAGRLVHGPREIAFEAGVREVAWDGRSGGRAAGSGVYLLRLTGGGETYTRRVLLLRD